MSLNYLMLALEEQIVLQAPRWRIPEKKRKHIIKKQVLDIKQDVVLILVRCN